MKCCMIYISTTQERENKMSNFVARMDIAGSLDETIKELESEFGVLVIASGGYNDSEIILTGNESEMMAFLKVNSNENFDSIDEYIEKDEEIFVKRVK